MKSLIYFLIVALSLPAVCLASDCHGTAAAVIAPTPAPPPAPAPEVCHPAPAAVHKFTTIEPETRMVEKDVDVVTFEPKHSTVKVFEPQTSFKAVEHEYQMASMPAESVYQLACQKQTLGERLKARFGTRTRTVSTSSTVQSSGAVLAAPVIAAPQTRVRTRTVTRTDTRA